MSFGVHMHSFLLDLYLQVQSLSHRVDVCLLLADTAYIGRLGLP